LDNRLVLPLDCARNITDILLVFMADNVYLYRYLDRRVPHQLDHSTGSYRKIPLDQYHALGYDLNAPCYHEELHRTCCSPDASWYLRGVLSAILHCSFKHVVFEKRASSNCLVLVSDIFFEILGESY